MRHEQERQPQPAWQKALSDFQEARERFIQDPTTGNLLFSEQYQRRLLVELGKPGKFDLGRTVATPGALTEMQRAYNVPIEFLIRHKNGDWGDLDEHDREENELSLREGYRLLSAYSLRNGERLWIITEHDRSATTLLLPSDY